MVSVTGQMSGATATYTCNSGHELVGTATRSCEDDGSSTGSAPTCVGMSTHFIRSHLLMYIIPLATATCPELSAPANGMVSVTGQRSGDTATYTCVSEYELNGSATRTCQATGMWSESAPTCVGRNLPMHTN